MIAIFLQLPAADHSPEIGEFDVVVVGVDREDLFLAGLDLSRYGGGGSRRRGSRRGSRSLNRSGCGLWRGRRRLRLREDGGGSL